MKRHIGEVFLPKAKRTAKKRGWRPAVEAVQKELPALLSSLAEGDARALLHAVLWSAVMKEIDRHCGDSVSRPRSSGRIHIRTFAHLDVAPRFRQDRCEFRRPTAPAHDFGG